MVHFSISRTLLLFCVIFNMVFIQPCRSLSRDDILAVHNTRRCVAVLDRETRDVISRLHLRRRGCRAGEHRRRYAVAVQSVTSSALRPDGIPTIIGNRPTVKNQQLFLGRCRHTFYGRRGVRTTVRSTVCRSQSDVRRSTVPPSSCSLQLPSLYLLNAAGLSKPHAVQHLAADLASSKCDVAVITETHFKSKHSDGFVSIADYTVFRRDRAGRRGGGVAVYVHTSLPASVWSPTTDDRSFELLWVRVDQTFIGSLYHPPRASYTTDDLINYIDVCITELTALYPGVVTILAGDFNQLSDCDLVQRTGLTPIVTQPTRAASFLDRIYVSRPAYNTVRVIKSLVRSDHSAVVAYVDRPPPAHKTTVQQTYRRVSPAQHASFLQYLSTLHIDLSHLECDLQGKFDTFYEIANSLLNYFYPLCTITVTSRDPAFVTPSIKANLRRKNRLMRKGHTEKANALAVLISKSITAQNKKRFRHINSKSGPKSLWSAVRQLTGSKRVVGPVDGISAESLNNHYSSISTDPQYSQPLSKSTCSTSIQPFATEWAIFRILDQLHQTSTGLDSIPAWFLRLAAPAFCEPITYLFNISISQSFVPSQWKSAWISPVPKVSTPKLLVDFRPISITSILSRIMERLVVRHYVYPAFLSDHPASLTFSDQYAFRPTGSTTAALIWIFHSITQLLSQHEYVIVIGLDFSKAFDTVRHCALLNKFALLDLPDNVYNWLVEFFRGHSHCTRYAGQTSDLVDISASIVQGSAIGPASYVVHASDLKSVTPGNRMCKYADDTYLIIPASNCHSRHAELDQIELWARHNNLKLNRSKCVEIIFTQPRRHRPIHPPSCLPGINRVSSIKILGVIITNKLSVSDHISNVISTCAQSIHALRTLRTQGMDSELLQTVYRAVIIAKLLYGSSAWWGFSSADDRRRLDAFIHRAQRSGFYPADQPTIAELVSNADDSLFHTIRYSPDHVLRPLLPEQNNYSYNLRNRTHNFNLSSQHDSRNFIDRVLYSNYSVSQSF